LEDEDDDGVNFSVVHFIQKIISEDYLEYNTGNEDLELQIVLCEMVKEISDTDTMRLKVEDLRFQIDKKNVIIEEQETELNDAYKEILKLYIKIQRIKNQFHIWKK